MIMRSFLGSGRSPWVGSDNGQVTEVEEKNGVIVLAASLFEDGATVTRKRKTREVLTVADSFRLLYTAPPMRGARGTVEHERGGVLSIEHGEFAAVQEFGRRLRRSFGQADGEPTNGVVAYHDKPHDSSGLSDHGAIPRLVGLLGGLQCALGRKVFCAL